MMTFFHLEHISFILEDIYEIEDLALNKDGMRAVIRIVRHGIADEIETRLSRSEILQMIEEAQNENNVADWYSFKFFKL